jgi:hypothetical protein
LRRDAAPGGATDLQPFWRSPSFRARPNWIIAEPRQFESKLPPVTSEQDFGFELIKFAIFDEDLVIRFIGDPTHKNKPS